MNEGYQAACTRSVCVYGWNDRHHVKVCADRLSIPLA